MICESDDFLDPTPLYFTSKFTAMLHFLSGTRSIREGAEGVAESFRYIANLH